MSLTEAPLPKPAEPGSVTGTAPRHESLQECMLRRRDALAGTGAGKVVTVLVTVAVVVDSVKVEGQPRPLWRQHHEALAAGHSSWPLRPSAQSNVVVAVVVAAAVLVVVVAVAVAVGAVLVVVQPRPVCRQHHARLGAGQPSPSAAPAGEPTAQS
mmetsp:Transcript_32098/g.92118  ORF Transcript_32098/g.92118 Transcript_32098/m.92118 type:complete len:155 (-) Transcript_32098:824-1288(-)